MWHFKFTFLRFSGEYFTHKREIRSRAGTARDFLKRELASSGRAKAAEETKILGC